MGIEFFRNSVKSEVSDYAANMATYGVRPHGSSMPVRFKRQAYASVRGDPVTTARELWEEIARGRLLVFADISEPFTTNLMESKLTYVTQVDVANPSVIKTRHISDPRLEINERVDEENRPACVIPRPRNIARRLMYFKRRYPGIPLLISKRDVKSASKLVPVSVRGYAYMGYRFAHYVGIYLALFSGWRPSPVNWG